MLLSIDMTNLLLSELSPAMGRNSLMLSCVYDLI